MTQNTVHIDSHASKDKESKDTLPYEQKHLWQEEQMHLEEYFAQKNEKFSDYLPHLYVT